MKTFQQLEHGDISDLPVKPGLVSNAGQRGKLLWYHRQEDYQLVISAGRDPDKTPKNKIHKSSCPELKQKVHSMTRLSTK